MVTMHTNEASGRAGEYPSRQIRLSDGRMLGYAEYGEPDGKPVLLFPGAPSSRLMYTPEEVTRAAGVRVVVAERPGFGLSNWQPRRRLLDWPEDATGLADALGLQRFAVLGVSAGGPYAAACAFALPERVKRTAIVGGVGPVDAPGGTKDMPRMRRLGVAVARHAPWLLRPLLWWTANPQRDPQGCLRRMLAGSSAVDLAILEQPEVKARLLANYLEATRQGVRGFAQDSLILSSPWGFRLAHVRVPVDLWHGEQDHSVSLSAAHYMAEAIPLCHARFLPGEGHWLFLQHWGEILAALVD